MECCGGRRVLRKLYYKINEFDEEKHEGEMNFGVDMILHGIHHDLPGLRPDSDDEEDNPDVSDNEVDESDDESDDELDEEADDDDEFDYGFHDETDEEGEEFDSSSEESFSDEEVDDDWQVQVHRAMLHAQRNDNDDDSGDGN